MNKTIVLFSLAISYLVVHGCTDIIGDVRERELSRIEIPGKSYKVRIIHIPSNATLQSSIQVRKLFLNKEEDVLQNYERYNAVDTAYAQTDSTLLIVLRDTISYLGNRPDTMYLKLN